MKKLNNLLALLILISLFPFNRAQAAGEWRFPVQLTYVNGITDVYDLYKSNLESEGYSVTSEFILPVAIAFNPQYEFNFGLRIGGGIGPMMMILTGEKNHFGIPLNFNVGFTILPFAQVSPYVRGGIMYHLAFGDYLEKSTPGIFAAAGIEFLRKKAVAFGFEVAMDFTELEFKTYDVDYDSWWGYEVNLSGTRKIKPAGLMIGLFIEF